MRRWTAIGLFVVLVGFALSIPMLARAESHEEADQAKAAPCPSKPDCGKTDKCNWQAGCQKMLKKHLEAGSPMALLGAAEALGLSPQQIQKLESIRDEAQRQALAVLTSEQTQKLKDLAACDQALCQVQAKLCPLQNKDCPPDSQKPCCAKDKKAGDTTENARDAGAVPQ